LKKHIVEITMNFNSNYFRKSFSIALGSVASVATLAGTSLAAPTSAVNPCPGIYYEEPHNSVRVVPPGCAPNAVTRLRNEQSQLPGMMMPAPTEGSLPQPLSSGEQPAIATVIPQAGKVNVRLKNTTNTSITYQAIGDTEQRTLTGGAEVMLQDLPAPTTLTFMRPDGGFVGVMPEISSEPGVLGLMLHEATGLSDSQTTVRIQSSGKVLAY
jgi:hypothetical protein